MPATGRNGLAIIANTFSHGRHIGALERCGATCAVATAYSGGDAVDADDDDSSPALGDDEDAAAVVGGCAIASGRRGLLGGLLVFAATLAVGERRKRRGAGRPTRFAQRMGPAHTKRHAFRNRPVHVTMRMRHDARANLRRGKVYARVRAVLRATREHLACRIVHFALLGNHLHLIVEAADDAALRAAMKGFAIRMARRVNQCLVDANGERRKGQVFAFRYDTHVLEKPLETRNTILYVLNNAKKHAAESGRQFDRFWLDPCSSAPSFDGWIPEAEMWLERRAGDDALVARPTHWLLTTGWRKHGLIDPGELPKLRRQGR